MKENLLNDALCELPDGMIDDCQSFLQRRKMMNTKKKIWLTVGSAAACLCLVALFLVSGFFGKQPITTPDLVFEHTDNFPALFFGIHSEGETAAPVGIWANPVRPGAFRTSITLGAELDKAKDNTYFAVKANFAVADAEGEEALQTAYAFFREQGVEAGILGDSLYLAATKAQLVRFLQGDFSEADLGAEFVLANPTEAQKDTENGIRY